ncbi:MAG TPA: hypothetical protein VL263_04755 [Vicinamibacterales bacterium]|nr:hypothetical protein [Vicinamibacterales bacterium]
MSSATERSDAAGQRRVAAFRTRAYAGRVRGARLEAGVYDPRTQLFTFSLPDEGHQITR